MSRSIWKGPHLVCSVLKVIKKSGIQKIWNRSSVIPESFLNKSIFIHNGNTFKKLLVQREHIGFKFGEFSFTRVYGSKRKKKLKK